MRKVPNISYLFIVNHIPKQGVDLLKRIVTRLKLNSGLYRRNSKGVIIISLINLDNTLVQ